jgi:hypothetical protein
VAALRQRAVALLLEIEAVLAIVAVVVLLAW